MDSGGTPEHVDVGAMRFGRPVAQGCRARGHGQGRRSVVRGSRFPRRRLAAGKSEPESFGGVRVLGRHGTRHEPL